MNTNDNVASRPGPSVQNEPLVHASQRVTRHVNDALALVNYAIETGFQTGEAEPLAQDIIMTIHTTGTKLGVLDDPHATNGGNERAITVAEWAAFELAYYRLAGAISPVTAETLRNTDGPSHDQADPVDGSKRSVWREMGNLVLGYSPALRFTRGLWMFAIMFAVFVVAADWRLQIMGQEGDTSIFRAERGLLQLLLPWAYGGLGSCVFLLRSAHSFIYQRTFDLRRKPEYFNRILLGTIAGGAIILFVHQIVGDKGPVIQISSAALGFLAGYSTDFLFSTIERIIAAIFPKVTPSDTARTPPRLSAPASGPDGRGEHSVILTSHR